jgi:phosphoglycerol transferase MdoB-like AlkP superfamily enzyme
VTVSRAVFNLYFSRAVSVLLAGVSPLALNFCMYCLYKFFGVERSLFAVEYFAVFFIALYTPLYISIFSFSFVFFIDLSFLVGAIFYFSPIDLIRFSEFAPTFMGEDQLLPAELIGLSLMLFMVGVAALWACRSVGRRGHAAGISTVAFIVATVLADVLNGSFMSAVFQRNIFKDERVIADVNVSTSFIKTLFDGVMAPISPSRSAESYGSSTLFERTPSAIGRYLDQVHGLTGHGTQHVVLVIVESWGYFVNPSYRNLVTKPIFANSKISQRFEFKTGVIPFNGGTTAAEMRELCSVNVVYYRLEFSHKRQCVPWMFAAKGYRTYAVHGYYASTFDRQRWWPEIGFQRPVFVNDLPKNVRLNRCGGAFRGACDDNVLAYAFGLLDGEPAKGKKFVYVLTLNSHAPIPSAEIPKKSEFDLYFSSRVIVGLLEKWKVVFDALAKELESADGRDLTLIIVGDHKPHLWEKSNSTLFSRTEVPYIIVTPKGAVAAR